MTTGYVGFSKGELYRVLEIDPEHPNIGLVELPEFLHPCWCTFENIKKTPVEFDIIVKNGRIINSGVPYISGTFTVQLLTP